MLEADRPYTLLVAKRSRGGIVSRGSRLGRQIRTKTQFEVRSGDFVISRRQVVHGACGIVPPGLDGAIVSNEYTVLRTNGPILAEFLALLAATPYMQRTFYHSSVGVHVEKMVFRDREWFRHAIHFPSVREQRAILETLGKWDTAIELADRLHALGRRRKTGLVQQLLAGKRRFKEFAGTSWRVRRLCEVAAVNPDSLSENTPANHRIWYIDLSSVDHGRLVGEPTAMTFGSAPSRARRLVRCGDALLSTVRPGLMGHLLIRDNTPNLVCSTGFAVVRASEPMDAPFLYHQFFGDSVQRQLGARLTGSGFPAVSSADVRRLGISYAENAEERRRIGMILELSEREIGLLEGLRHALDRQRRGVAELLLTGKVRVPA